MRSEQLISLSSQAEKGGCRLDGECDVLRRISLLSRIPLSQEEFSRLCEEFKKISEFLSLPSRLLKEIDLEPLLHPHDIEYEVEEVEGNAPVEIENLLDKEKVYRRLVKVPWGARG